MTTKADAAIIAAYQKEMTMADVVRLIAIVRKARKR